MLVFLEVFTGIIPLLGIGTALLVLISKQFIGFNVLPSVVGWTVLLPCAFFFIYIPWVYIPWFYLPLIGIGEFFILVINPLLIRYRCRKDIAREVKIKVEVCYNNRKGVHLAMGKNSNWPEPFEFIVPAGGISVGDEVNVIIKRFSVSHGQYVSELK